VNQVVVRGTSEWSPTEGPLIQIVGIEGVAVKSELPPEYLAMYPHIVLSAPARRAKEQQQKWLSKGQIEVRI